jgi:hypothetical protein
MAAGRRVLAAATIEANGSPVAPDIPAGASLEDALRAIGEAAAGGPVRLVPFKVGEAWVMAPETREAVNMAAKPLPAGFLDTRGNALDSFLSGLTPAEIRRIASPDGLAFVDLPADAKAALMYALRPPMRLTALAQGYVERIGWRVRAVHLERWIREPLPWPQTRLHAALEPVEMVWDLGLQTAPPADVNVTSPYDETPGQEKVTAFLEWEPPNGTLELRSGMPSVVTSRTYMPDAAPWLPWVPNTPKPSDLNGTSLSEPLGMHGRHTVQEVVEQLSQRTGKTLSVALIYRELPVFIGSNQLTCGEAMDGLCLALAGAWRAVGGRYVLAWDREGAAPVTQRLVDAWAPFTDGESGYRRSEERDRSAAWPLLARNLPFCAGDPLALTDAQRERVIREFERLPEHSSIHLPYTALTPSQQTWVRERAVQSPVPGYAGAGPISRRLTEAEMRRGNLVVTLQAILSLDIPGRSPMRVDPRMGTWYGAIGGRRLFPLPPEPEEVSNPGDAPPAGWVDETLRSMPIVVGGSLAAVMVPPLPGARLAILAGEM